MFARTEVPAAVSAVYVRAEVPAEWTYYSCSTSGCKSNVYFLDYSPCFYSTI